MKLTYNQRGTRIFFKIVSSDCPNTWKLLFDLPTKFRHIGPTLKITFVLQVETGDLIAYGLIPEFIGRFPVLVSLSALDEDQLVQVCTKVYNTVYSLILFSDFPWWLEKVGNAHGVMDEFPSNLLWL